MRIKLKSACMRRTARALSSVGYIMQIILALLMIL